jgi:5-methylcytosine-specific restriction endonuclease McrBC regulatory subunit McrC
MTKPITLVCKDYNQITLSSEKLEKKNVCIDLQLCSEEDVAKKLFETVDDDEISHSTRLKRWKGQIWSDKLVGVSWLAEKEDIALIIKPRFGNSEFMAFMLSKVLEDEDAYKFLDAEDKEGAETKNAEDKEDALKFFEIMDKDPKVPVDAEHQKDFLIFQIVLFMNRLHELCQKTIRYQPVFVKENLLGKVKGRILINEQLRVNEAVGRQDRMYCQFQKLSIDCLENRILKAAMEKSMRYLAQKGLITSLSHLTEQYAYCSRILQSVTLTDIRPQDFRGLRFNGVFRLYKKATELAKPIIEGIGLADSDIENNKITEVPPYYINITLLFEYYCRVLVKEALNAIGGYSLKEYYTFKEINSRKYQDFNVFDDDKKSGILSPFLIPDIWIEKRDEKRYILDVKYTDLESGSKDKDRARRHTHQLLAYGYKFNADGLGLIYPRKNTENNNNEKIFEKNIEEVKEQLNKLIFNNTSHHINQLENPDKTSKTNKTKDKPPDLPPFVAIALTLPPSPD